MRLWACLWGERRENKRRQKKKQIPYGDDNKKR